jgi:hypothetical protein
MLPSLALPLLWEMALPLGLLIGFPSLAQASWPLALLYSPDLGYWAARPLRPPVVYGQPTIDTGSPETARARYATPAIGTTSSSGESARHLSS